MDKDNDNELKDAVIEDVSPVKKKINLKIDKKKTEEVFDRKLADAAKKSNIKGFRPGKAPLAVIKKYYGSELYEEAAMEILNEDFRKIIFKHNLNVVGTPRLESKPTTEATVDVIGGNTYLTPAVGDEYTLHFEIMPEIKDLNLDLKIKAVEKREITEEVLNEEIDFLLERAAEPVELDKSKAINAEDKYFVKIDYITIDNETNKEVDSAKNYSISLNSKMIDKSFESSFIGKKAGESFEFNDAERKVTVKGVIKEIDKKILPELNAETIKNFGEFKDVDEFKKYVEKSLNEYENKRYKEGIRSAISDELVKLNHVEFPESVVEEDAAARLKELKNQGKYKDADKKQEAELMQILKIMAKRDLALYLLLSEISKKENVIVSETDFDDFFKKSAEESNVKEEEIRKYYSDKEAVNNLRQALLEDKIFDFLISNKVSYI